MASMVWGERRGEGKKRLERKRVGLLSGKKATFPG